MSPLGCAGVDCQYGGGPTHDTEQEAIECYNNCLGNEDPIAIEEGSYRKYPEQFWNRSPSMYITEFERLNHLTGEE